MDNELTVAGVHCGLGNLEGFKQAGFKVEYLIDDREHIWKGRETFYHNFPEAKLSTDMGAFKDKNPLVILSSPSCAQISSLGMKRKDRAELAELTMENFDFVKTLILLFERNPDFIIIEYLSSLLDHFVMRHTLMEKRYSDQYLAFPEKYRTQILEFNASSFGVPQNRKRLFIVFSDKKYDFITVPPALLSLQTETSGEVLERLDRKRKAAIESGEPLLNDQNPKHSAERTEGFSKLQYGESYYGTANNKRIHPNKICPTITSHRTRHVHPWYPRVLNVRECATFQGFPLSFKFFGSESVQLDFIGKSVPPAITRHFAAEILRRLKIYKNNQQIEGN